VEPPTTESGTLLQVRLRGTRRLFYTTSHADTPPPVLFSPTITGLVSTGMWNA